MTKVVALDDHDKINVLIAIIKNEKEMTEQDQKETKQCISEFQFMMLSLSLYFNKSINLTNSLNTTNVSISSNDDCLKKMTSIVRANVFNNLFEWLEFAEKMDPNFNIKQITQSNGINLTNFMSIIYKTPKPVVYAQ